MTPKGDVGAATPAEASVTFSKNSENSTGLLSDWQRQDLKTTDVRGVDLDLAAASRLRGANEYDAGDASAAANSYVEACEFAVASGDSLAAIDDLQTAIQLEPDVVLRGAHLHKRALIADSLRHENASRFWQELAEHCRRENQTELQAQALLHGYFAADSESRAHLLDRARALGEDTMGWGACAAAVSALVNADLNESIAHGEKAIELSRIAGDRLLEAMSSRIIAIALSYIGETKRAIDFLKSAVALGAMGRSPMEVLRAKQLLIELLQDDMRAEDALDESHALLVYTRDNHLHGWLSYAECGHAAALLNCGQIQEAHHVAETHLRRLLSGPLETIDLNTAFEAIICGYVLAEIGTESETYSFESIADVIETCAEASGYESYLVEARLLRARAFAINGKLEEAVDLGISIEIDEPQTMAIVGQWLARIGAWYGSHPEHVTIAERAKKRAREIANQLLKGSITSPCARIVSAKAEEIVATVDCNMDGLRRSARRWNAAGYSLFAARCSAFSANFEAQKSSDGSVAALLDAYQELLQLGATGDAAILARHLYETSAAANNILADVSNDDATLLDRGSAFAALDDGARTALLTSMASLAVRSGTMLGSDDRTSESLMMIRSGSVRLFRPIDNGKQLTLALLERGDVFGADSLLGASGRQIHAEVTEDAQLGVVPAAHLRQLIRQHPQIALQLLDTVGDRLSRAQQLAEQVAYWSVRRRVASALVDLDTRYGHPTLSGGRIINKTISQAEIADLIGATRKAVTETLSKLRTQGLVDSRGRRIVLTAVSELKRIADGDE